MTRAHRARLIAALTKETGLSWRQHDRSACGLTTDGDLLLFRSDGSRRDHVPPCTVIERVGTNVIMCFDYEPSGRGWPERLAVEVARNLKEGRWLTV